MGEAIIGGGLALILCVIAAVIVRGSRPTEDPHVLDDLEDP